MRAATLVRLVVGSASLVWPARSLALVGGPDQDDARTRSVARVLGARQVVQGVADVALGRRTRGLDVAVDLLHAATMVPAAVRWPRHRRTAVVSGATAVATAMLDLRQNRPDAARR